MPFTSLRGCVVKVIFRGSGNSVPVKFDVGVQVEIFHYREQGIDTKSLGKEYIYSFPNIY